MLTINLLPQEEKKIIYLTEMRRRVALFTVCFFLVFVIGVALLLPSYFSAYFSRRDIEHSLVVAEQSAAGRGATREVLAEAKQVRNAANEVRSSLAQHAAGAEIMEKLSASGAGITITSLFIRSAGDITVEGRAETRDHLLAFEQRLRASDLFLEVSFPLADIVRERDIQFSAHAKLKLPLGL